MQHSIRFATGLLLAALLASCGGERTARTFRPPSGGCTTGSLLPCQCPDGRDGLATCNGERYGGLGSETSRLAKKEVPSGRGWTMYS